MQQYVCPCGQVFVTPPPACPKCGASADRFEQRKAGAKKPGRSGDGDETGGGVTVSIPGWVWVVGVVLIGLGIYSLVGGSPNPAPDAAGGVNGGGNQNASDGGLQRPQPTAGVGRPTGIARPGDGGTTGTPNARTPATVRPKTGTVYLHNRTDQVVTITVLAVRDADGGRREVDGGWLVEPDEMFFPKVDGRRLRAARVEYTVSAGDEEPQPFETVPEAINMKGELGIIVLQNDLKPAQ